VPPASRCILYDGMIIPMHDVVENEWLVPANPAVYDHAAAFAVHDVITWGLKTNNKAGDIVYLYTSVPGSRIAYKCVVEKAGVRPNERIGDEFWVEPFAYDASRKYINIRLLTRFADDDRLTLRYLVDNKLMKAAPQGPRHLDRKLSAFLGSI